MEELSTQAEFDSEIRFKTLALKGDKKRGLELLVKIDNAFSAKSVLALLKLIYSNLIGKPKNTFLS